MSSSNNSQIVSFKEALEIFGNIAKEDRAVKVGDIYNIGIGFGESADCIVIEIIKGNSEGDQAKLEMIDFGGPAQICYVSYLQKTCKKIEGAA